MKETESILESCPVRLEIPVAWGEMDAYQHVNNIVYFRYFENARIAYFLEVGYPERLEKTGVGPILASTHCRFKAPLTYPDTVTAATRVSEIGTDRFTMDYFIVSRKTGRVAAEGQGVIISYDYRNARKAPLPTEIVERIRRLEKLL